MEQLLVNDQIETMVSRRRMSVSDAMQKIIHEQCNEISQRILSYEVMAHRNPDKFNYDSMPQHIDILIFGPAGAGKTSLIKTFYRAVHGSAAVHNELIVKSKVANEGTLLYTKCIIKGTEAKFEKKGKKYEVKDDQIIIHDTRGQIWMDQREQA